MKIFDKKSFATRAVLALLASTPAAAFAADVAPKALCEVALADPVAFRGRADFDASVAMMADVCPEVVLMLLDVPTQSIVLLQGDGGAAGATTGPTAVDNSALLGALAAALENLKNATAAVTTAQATLDRATVRVRAVRALQVAVAAKADVQGTLLVDFTSDLRDALSEYNAAKQNLADKQEALEDARTAAAVEFDIAGVTASVGSAQSALDDALGDKTYEQLVADYTAAKTAADATVTAKRAEAAALATEIAALQVSLDAKGNLNALQGKANAASNQSDTKQRAYDAAQADAITKWNLVLASQVELSICLSQNGNCNGAENRVDQAYRAYVSADADKVTKYNAYVAARDEAAAAQALVNDYRTAQAAIDAKTAAKTAAEQAAADATAAASTAQGEIDALGGLQDALAVAAAALEDAQASVTLATAEEDEAVADAQTRLDAAIAHAVDLLDGSPEEAAAEKAITDAQVALDAALKAQAQAVADAAAATAEAEGNTDAEVVAAVKAIDTAVGEGGEAADTAEDKDSVADAVLDDHQEAHDALEDQLVTDGVIKSVDDCDCGAPADPSPVASVTAASGVEDPSPASGDEAGSADASDSAAATDAGGSDASDTGSASDTGAAATDGAPAADEGTGA